MVFSSKEGYGDLAVVGARVDPCFLDELGGSCRRQIRLVAQPLSSELPAVAADAAVHLSYDLSAEGFDAVVAELGALREMAGTATTCAPLGVHPVISAEGTTGPYATRLRALLTTSAGADRLTRIAVAQRRGWTAWQFSSFDVAGGQLSPLRVGRAGDSTRQTLWISDTAPSAFLDPVPTGSGMPLLLDGERIAVAEESALTAASRETAAIENPLRETVGSIDCASCHVSRRALERAQSLRSFAIDASGAYQRDDLDLSLNSDVAQLGAQRAFGYFGATPSLTPRTIHESAEVAAALSAR